MCNTIVIGIFLFCIIVQLSILIWLFSCSNNISTFSNAKYNRTIEDVLAAWKKTGCDKELSNIEIDNFRKLSNISFNNAINFNARKVSLCRKTQEQPQLSIEYLLPQHKNELNNMWINAKCGNIRFPAQNLNRFYKKSYISSNNKNIVFEDIKNWLNGEIEDMCG